MSKLKGNNRVTIIIQNCNQCLLDGPLVILNKLYEAYKVKHPNAWHIMQMQRNNHWDGYVKYISETGKFRIGLLQEIHGYLTKVLKCEVKVIDRRPPISIIPSIPSKIGELTIRPKQKEVLEIILKNQVAGVPLYIGVQDLAVNFGKSLIMAAIFLAFKSKLKTLLITNDSDWLEQSKAEFPKLLPGQPISFIKGGKVNNWEMFSIGMIQSISRNMDNYQRELSSIDIVLIDECDQADNKSYKYVIQHLYNTRVRLGLSGTVYMSELKKDRIFNLNIKSFLGSKLTEIRLKDTIKSGDSTKVVVKLVPTNYNENRVKLGYYDQEYKAIITENPKSFRASLQRAKFNLRYGRIPMLIVTKYIEHCELLYKYYKRALDDTYTIAYVHSGTNTKSRNKIISDFRGGKIDILISNSFIARGKNFPLLRYLQNNASMDSNEKIIQLLGRLVRTHASKKKTYMDDMAYNGKYLTRHAKHRKNFYMKEGLKVIKVKVKYPMENKLTK